MAKPKKEIHVNTGLIAENRKARHLYFIEDTLEAGLVLLGTEVKSIRLQGGVSLMEAHAAEKEGEIYLFNANIPEYKMATFFNHEAKRPRKLLLNRRELNKLIGAIKRQGITVIPLKMYFNNRGIIKILLGIAKGKKQADKRATEKQRDWQRQKERLMKAP